MTASWSFFLYLRKIYSIPKGKPIYGLINYSMSRRRLIWTWSQLKKKATARYGYCKQTEWLTTFVTVWSEVTNQSFDLSSQRRKLPSVSLYGYQIRKYYEEVVIIPITMRLYLINIKTIKSVQQLKASLYFTINCES